MLIQKVSHGLSETYSRILAAYYSMAAVRLLVVIIMGISAAAVFAAAPVPVSTSTLVVEGVKVHPAMALTPESVKRGRENYRKFDWAKEIGDELTSTASVWLSRDAEWIKKHMPGKAACFAYGFAGCPECGGKTGIWAAADCSFEEPGKVKCSGGHTLPNEKYPDAGTGYKGPDGRMHYFVGTYNAWAIEKFIYGAYELAYAYSLTGDERYAERCAEILDSVADIYPTCTIGSWDYPETRPGQNSGRFNRPQYQVGRVLIPLSDMYDQIFHCAALQEPSVRAGMTRAENIEKNMLLDGARYCYEKSFNFGGLTNGSADYIKGAMVVGLVLGIPEYVKWAVDGPYGIRSMLANNIGRDGTYYETATGYSYYTRFIYRGYAEYLRNYRGSAYPEGVDLYEDARFRDFMLMLNLKTQIGGGIPSYGDAAPVTAEWEVKETPFEKYDFECLEYLRLRATDPEEKKKLTRLSDWLSDGTPEKYYAASASAKWFLFNAEPLEETDKAGIGSAKESILKSSILGQKGMAFLRVGEDADSQGVMLRYGPALNHANFDDLNFTYHALGHDLTYDLGYALASAHVYSGWSKQTASHQLVVVDEKSQGAEAAPTGGELRAFWSGNNTAAVEASAPGAYRSQGVEEYGRTMFLVDDGMTTEAGGVPYLVDIFRVSGGSKHDSFTHAPGRDVKYGGVEVGEATSSSLAGEGMEWGDKILVDGDVAGQPNKPYWVAPPGNGYGFLMEPQELKPEGKSWWAEWKLGESDDKVKIWFPEKVNEKALTAWGPGILHNLPDAQYVVRRREPESGRSVFVTVWEPYAKESSIAAVDHLVFDEKKTSWPAVAVKVTHKHGRVDLVYSSADEQMRRLGKVEVAGRLARVSSKDEKVTLAEGLGVISLKVDGQVLADGVAAGYRGKVTDLDVNGGVVFTDAEVPKDVEGLMVTFSNPGYSRSTAYTVKSVEPSSKGTVLKLTEEFVLGRGVVDEVNETSRTITSLVSHEYVRGVNRKGDSEFFKGKRIATAGGADARVVKAALGQPLVLTVDDVVGFKAGDAFVYEDVQVGDGFEILIPTGLRR